MAESGKVWLVDSEIGVRHWPSGRDPALFVLVAFSAEDRGRAFLSAGGLAPKHWLLSLTWRDFRDTLLTDLQVFGINWQGPERLGV